MILRRACASIVAVLLITTPVPASAQTTAGQNATSGDVTIAGSLRARSYSWKWFGDDPGGAYTYPALLVRVGLSQTHDRYQWMAEFAAPALVGLPSTAVAPAPQGQKGLGATYFAANNGDSTTASIFLKQGYVRLKHLGGVNGQSLTLGRMEFNDGAETIPKNDTLATLKRDRISQRLLGTFGFSDVGRSIDGGLYTLSTSGLTVTALAGRPTQGVFDVNGWPELNINLFYGAVTREIASDRTPGELRVFAVAYNDRRQGVAKTDNRAAATRTADTGTVAIGTYGGHYLQTANTSLGPIDLLFWGALQTGSWGSLSQRADAFAVEAGWQPANQSRVKPWLRAGFDYGSGDDNPNDGTHGTFFQILPTPRVYARLPFFNMMNMQDAFGELVLRPSRRLTVRGDIHALRLSDATDLWYSGGGAFQAQTFGYTGRPSSGRAGLATLYDVGADYAVDAHLSVNGYYGFAAARSLAQAIYPAGTGTRFGYVELLVRF